MSNSKMSKPFGEAKDAWWSALNLPSPQALAHGRSRPARGFCLDGLERASKFKKMLKETISLYDSVSFAKIGDYVPISFCTERGSRSAEKNVAHCCAAF